MSGSCRPLMLFGAHGRLGSAIADAASRVGASVGCITWAEAKPWRRRWDAAAILSRFAEVCEGTDIDVLFANGLTDPGQSIEELLYSNCEFPIRVIEAMRDAPGMRFLTFGTVMEEFSQLADTNHYLASKRALAARIESLALDPDFSGRLRHFRLHTLYGGVPAPHLFLGQICASLQRDESFLMSDGHQLREFHHVDDVARSVRALCGRPWDCGVTVTLSFGHPVQLRTFAETIFAGLGRSHLLHLGRVTTPPGENFERIIPRSPEWLIGDAREATMGVIDWLGSLIGAASMPHRHLGGGSPSICK
jgi:nucleoside-diphosphate-sugar epimerase